LELAAEKHANLIVVVAGLRGRFVVRRAVAELVDLAVVVVVQGVFLSGAYYNSSSTQISTIEARRLPSGETALSTPKSLGPSDQPPSAVALSENATAVLLTRSGQVSVAVETWP
jgi:hypothetical protein